MSKNLTKLIIHVTDTPFGRNVTPDDILFWHKFPCKNSNGTITYLGKTYPNVNSVPNDSYNINGQDIFVRKNLIGRGWTVTGYSDLIQIDGELKNLNPYDFNNIVDPWEITNGAAGVNSVSRHVVLAGGGSNIDTKRKNVIMSVTEVLNEKQIETLIEYIRMQRELVPNINIAGHNEFSTKTCPNFNVKKFLIDYKV